MSKKKRFLSPQFHGGLPETLKETQLTPSPSPTKHPGKKPYQMHSAIGRNSKRCRAHYLNNKRCRAHYLNNNRCRAHYLDNNRCRAHYLNNKRCGAHYLNNKRCGAHYLDNKRCRDHYLNNKKCRDHYLNSTLTSYQASHSHQLLSIGAGRIKNDVRRVARRADVVVCIKFPFPAVSVF